MNFTVAMVVISSVGLSLSAFFSLYLLNSKRWKSLANTLLGLLLLVLTLRIGKAIFFNFTELPLAIKNLGLAANLAAGPLLFLYGKALFKTGFQWRTVHAFHFLPASLYVLFCWYIPNGTGDLFWMLSYGLVLLQSYTYAVMSLRMVLGKQNQRIDYRWYLYLVLGLLGMWLVYGVIFMGLLAYHIAGAISFSLLMLFLASMALNRQGIFLGETRKKYSQSKMTEAEVASQFELIHEAVRRGKLFLEADMNLTQIANAVSMHPKVVSEVINRAEGKSFINYINALRIEEAKKLLVTAPDLKIAAIAFQCGFNSLSSFNAVFKTETGQTPSQYRSSH